MLSAVLWMGTLKYDGYCSALHKVELGLTSKPGLLELYGLSGAASGKDAGLGALWI